MLENIKGNVTPLYVLFLAWGTFHFDAVTLPLYLAKCESAEDRVAT